MFDFLLTIFYYLIESKFGLFHTGSICLNYQNIAKNIFPIYFTSKEHCPIFKIFSFFFCVHASKFNIIRTQWNIFRLVVCTPIIRVLILVLLYTHTHIHACIQTFIICRFTQQQRNMHAHIQSVTISVSVHAD